MNFLKHQIGSYVPSMEGQKALRLQKTKFMFQRTSLMGLEWHGESLTELHFFVISGNKYISSKTLTDIKQKKGILMFNLFKSLGFSKIKK